jgi:YbgC/YbaW family acyl-CoA thioester hydrolase
VSEHRLTRRVQFYETDAGGIVHFSVYFRYMEEAEHALWRAAGLSIHDRDAAFGWPRVQASFDYYRPLRFEEEFEARIRIVAIEERKISYLCLLTRGETRIATGRMTIACATRLPNEPMRGTAIPPEIRARFAVVALDMSDAAMEKSAAERRL